MSIYQPMVHNNQILYYSNCILSTLSSPWSQHYPNSQVKVHDVNLVSSYTDLHPNVDKHFEFYNHMIDA